MHTRFDALQVRISVHSHAENQWFFYRGDYCDASFVPYSTAHQLLTGISRCQQWLSVIELTV